MRDHSTDMTREEIASLLLFYQESGLDFPVSNDAINRFEAEEARPSTRPPQASENTHSEQKRVIASADTADTIEMDPRKRKADEPRPIAEASASVTLPSDEVVANAVSLATAAQDLDALKVSVETFEGCNLKRSARSTVFEGGKRGARLMLISGCPSRDDDVSGTALSGADGILLEKMLAAIGLSRHEDVYHGFCVPWSPPGGSAPTPLHLEICAPFLAKQIQLAAPEIVIVMGNIAARHVFQSKQTVVQLRGKWTNLPNFGIDAMAMLDPAMLRSQPRMKRGAWSDLLAIKSRLDSNK
ncbi:MAG: uracil-DNA glycosylase [Pseudomonadota bacterium]